MKNLLFIPCYRCAPQIVRVLKKIQPHLHFFDEVIIIDNISPDETAARALAFVKEHQLPKVRVMQNPDNVGLGGSHKLAFSYALENNFDHAVILHGDDQGELSDFVPVLEMARTKELDSFWMGARFHPSSRLEGYSLFRIFGNVVFNSLASLLATRTIFDLGGSGVNLFPVKLLKEHQFKTYSNDLTFHVFLLLNAFRLQQRVTFTPVSWKEDDQISNVKLVSQSLKLLKLLRTFFTFPHLLLREEKMNFPFGPRDWKIL